MSDKTTEKHTAKPTEKRTLVERLSNWFYAIPAVAQWWARRTAQQTQALVGMDDEIPFAAVTKPLRAMRFALVTTGGFHTADQTPYDMENPDGDTSWREIPATVAADALTITHKYYDHSDADADPNVVFPLDILRDLVARGVIGQEAPRHFSFMGHIDGPLVQELVHDSAPAVAGMLKQDQVDAVLLTPA